MENVEQVIEPEQPAQAEQPVPVEPEQQQSPLSKIDKVELSHHILDLLRQDIKDREEFGWTSMRKYDQLAYDGYKGKAKEPWLNSSNYAVCLTPTLLDTGHANVVGSIFSDEDKVVDVRGVGKEDVRNEKNLSSLLNWQVLNNIEDAYDTIDKTVHCAFKHGNAAIKVIQGYGPQKNKVIWARVPIENLFLPITARGAQPSQTDHIFELIPLTENEKNQRKYMKGPDGKAVYENIDAIQKGNRVQYSSALQEITNTKDMTSGTSLGEHYSNQMYYILECYLTYWVKTSETEMESIELTVWISPNGGDILAMVENKPDEESGEAVRPYSTRWCPYPREDRFYGDSLPWMIRQSQEEVDYAHNQVFNAIEKLIDSPTFYDPAGAFDPETVQQTPNGWYPVPNPRNNIFIPAYDFGPIFQHYRSFDLFWEYAQRRTGFTELFQGRAPEQGQTLGEAKLRTNKTEIRFTTIYKRFEEGWKELIHLNYYYSKLYLDKDVVIKVLGTADYSSVGELFPEGIKGKYDFAFSSSTLLEKAERKNNAVDFFERAKGTRIVAENPVNEWRMLNMLSEAYGIRNFETILSKPKGASVLSADEAIQRIMSGQFDLVPEPTIEADAYMFKIQSFMKTDSFKRADQQTQQAVMLLLRRADMIYKGQMRAMQDAQILQAGAQAQAMPAGPAEPGVAA